MAPTSAARPAGGLFAAPRPVRAIADLFANVWQLGYVTTDLDRAIEELRARFGLEHCVEVPTAGATFMVGDEVVPWTARFAMAARETSESSIRRTTLPVAVPTSAMVSSPVVGTT